MEKLNCSIDGFLNLSASPQAKPICSDYSSAAKAFHALLKFSLNVTIHPGNQSLYPHKDLFLKIRKPVKSFCFESCFFQTILSHLISS